MRRLLQLALCASTFTAACKVEPTPPEYFDHRESIALVRDEAAEELQARILALGQALNRGNSAEILLALAPAPDAYMLGAERDALISGARPIAAALERFAREHGPLRIQDLQVTVGSQADIAWFRAKLQTTADAEGTELRITGVYVRGSEGEWNLVQAHLSTPGAPGKLPPPSPGEDASTGEAG